LRALEPLALKKMIKNQLTAMNGLPNRDIMLMPSNRNIRHRDYRWGDQQWWPRPLAMFGSGNLEREIDVFDEINTDNEKFVVHKQWPRYQTIPHVRYFEDGRDRNGSFIIPGGLSVKKMAGRKRRDGLYERASKCFAKWAWRNDCPSIIT